ncbi:hypothetical protein ALC57_15066, partial [Trachymyrmex cornetzi]
LISLDVVSLFTNIPIDLALDSISLRWPSISNRTNIKLPTCRMQLWMRSAPSPMISGLDFSSDTYSHVSFFMSRASA